MDSLIEIQDICKIYNPGENEVRALDHVDLKINRGEFVAIRPVVAYPYFHPLPRLGISLGNLRQLGKDLSVGV